MGGVFSGPTPASYNYKLEFDSSKAEDPSGEVDVAALLERADAALSQIENYKSCQPFVKKAIEAPKDQAVNSEAAVALKDNILAIKSWYDLAEDMAAALPKIAQKIAAAGNITDSPGLTLALAKMVGFVYRFDQAKMYESGVQNDFSGYRRVMSKVSDDVELPLDESQASVVSMFVAQPGPFVHRLGTALKTASASAPVLAELANACSGAVDRSKGKAALSETSADFDRCVMVGAVVLYDRAASESVFTSRDVAIVKICTTAKKRGGADSVKHCSAIQYSTQSYASACARVQDLLE